MATKAQIIRFLRGNRNQPVVPAPGLTTAPVIVSSDPGVYQVGVQLTVTPGVYTGSPVLVGYQWKRNGADIAGAEAASYLPVVADEGTTLTCTETVQNISGSLSTTTAGVGPVIAGEDPGTPPPNLADALAGVDADTISRRTSIVNEFTGRWPGHDGETFTTDVLVTSTAAMITQFDSVLRAAPLSGWHRIRLDSTQPSSAWTAGASIRGASVGAPDNWVWTVGEYFNSPADRASVGGGIVIESSDTNNPVMVSGTWTIRGVRGLHIKSVMFSKEATDTTGTARDACQMVVITSSATNRDAGVVRLENCKIGTLWNPANVTDLRSGVGVTQTGTQEQIDVINCQFKGVQTGIKGSGTRFAKFEGNDFQKVIGDAMIWLHTAALVNANSAWDERVIWWTRLNTMRNMVDQSSASGEHTDFAQAGTSGDIGGYSILHEFETSYAKRLAHTDARYVTYSANPTDGATLTIKGTVFTFRDTPTLSTDIQIGVSLSATIANAKPVIQAAGLAGLNRIGTSSTVIQIHFESGQLGTISASVGSIGNALRVAGGTQFLYHDDLGTPYSMECVMICCLGTTNDGIGGTIWNGTGVIDRCTVGRPGDQPVNAVIGTDGFNYSYDLEAYFTSSRKASTVSVTHHMRNSVIGHVLHGAAGGVIRDEDGTYTVTNGSLTLANNRYAKWQASAAAPEKASTLMDGVFGTDAQGRTRYDFTDDPEDTQAQFRLALYNQLRLDNVTDRASIGCTSPATWV